MEGVAWLLEVGLPSPFSRLSVSMKLAAKDGGSFTYLCFKCVIIPYKEHYIAAVKGLQYSMNQWS